MRRNNQLFVISRNFCVWSYEYLSVTANHLKKKKGLFLLYLFLSVTCIVSSQQHFKYIATIDSVKQSGFYRIELPLQVLGKCNKDFGDLRILDSEGKSAPYLLLTENGEHYNTPMIDLPIINKEKEADKQWHLTIENSLKRNIDRLVLTLKGTSVNRKFTLSGSDDKKNWYGILENYSPELTMFDKGACSLYFPSNNYKYFQVTLIGKDLLPIDIVKASIYSNKVFAPKYSTDPISFHFIQKDSSNKRSYIRISFEEPYPIEKMVLDLGPIKFYKRHFSIFNSLNDKPLSDTIISTFDDNYTSINLSSKEKELWLVIDNNDNSPLKVHGIYFKQYNRYLVAYLDSLKKYNLLFGDSTIEAPNYDIEFFKDSIKNNIPTISFGTINKINVIIPTPISTSNKKKWLLWVGIIVMLVLLSVITFKMLKEVNESGNR